MKTLLQSFSYFKYTKTSITTEKKVAEREEKKSKREIL